VTSFSDCTIIVSDLKGVAVVENFASTRSDSATLHFLSRAIAAVHDKTMLLIWRISCFPVTIGATPLGTA
jgi:hypothetical protein